ncbi:glycoside hydrolase family 95 protein [Odoribacter lunatus]|uniref:glycoside hydrolase family 95 protein n=1 Tax=Odoribacter lunatus TaxID=2941335 RepID=UPI0020402E7B|nr:glycoside hydrolase N-terminal domain-containing protein [Odoribacter lunatus]
MKKQIEWIVYFLLLSSFSAVAQDWVLEYDKPARNWMNEALPIGNGYMGAMFFGGPVTDEVQVSEESFWAGGVGANKKYRGGNRRESWRYLDTIRELLKQGEKAKAAELAERYFIGETTPTAAGDQFGDFGGNQTFGSLFVTVETSDTLYGNYRRMLDLSKAEGRVRYIMGGIRFENTYFASYPARLLVMKYTNDAPKGKDYAVEFRTPHLHSVKAVGKDLLEIKGTLASNGLPFEGKILVKTDGKPAIKDGKYRIKSATWLELYLTVASAYRNSYPDYTGNDYEAVNNRAITWARNTDFDVLRHAHQQDFGALFNRVEINLGHSGQEQLTTDKRQLQYAQGAYDPGLEALYFQYGRYLLISSSREGTMPAHLQGRWNHELNAPWACDYHMNINLQMIYWPAEVTNLSECHLPLIEYIDKLREPGRVTAKEYFNARGWSVHTMNNAYGYTAPGWSFYWGYAPNSAAWLCRHLWEHFNYTGDEQYLKEKAWSIMKEAGEFWLDYLSEDTDGTLVSSPSYSPEHGDIAIGATIDQEIAWDLFTNLLAAYEYVKEDTGFIDSIRAARERLSPLKIGRFGQLQEWKEDLDDPRNPHRHVSHLYALYPGCQISPAQTPQMAEAAKRTLVYRGEEGTGWSLAWKINFWARLLDGNQSYKMLRNILRPSLSRGDYRNPSGSGSYANLLCAHPPFQIDGNMGAVAGIAELLLQSYDGTVNLLPALPTAWPTGSVKGLKARGGYTVDMSWKDGLLKEASVTASQSGSCRVKYREKEKVLTLQAGETVRLDW